MSFEALKMIDKMFQDLYARLAAPGGVVGAVQAGLLPTAAIAYAEFIEEEARGSLAAYGKREPEDTLPEYVFIQPDHDCLLGDIQDTVNGLAVKGYELFPMLIETCIVMKLKGAD